MNAKFLTDDFSRPYASIISFSVLSRRKQETFDTPRATAEEIATSPQAAPRNDEGMCEVGCVTHLSRHHCEVSRSMPRAHVVECIPLLPSLRGATLGQLSAPR